MIHHLQMRATACALSVLVAAACAISPNSASAQPSDGAALEHLQAHFGSADSNRDGAVSRGEFAAYRATQWSRLDRNEDGFLSQADLPRVLQARWNGARATEMRRYYDADHDGRVSRQEYLSGPTPAFDRADTNNDNVVTKAEMNAAARREIGR